MASNNKILDRVQKLKAIGLYVVEEATSIEKELLAGEGKKPASAQKAKAMKQAVICLAKRNKSIYGK